MPQTITPEIRIIINEAVNTAFQAGRIHAGNETADAYKKTEKRLYAYPVLINKIESDKQYIDELINNGAPEKSKSVTRFSRSGMRLTPDEILDFLLQDTRAQIAKDEHEVERITAALKTIEDDPYYVTVTDKYFNGLDDEDIAEYIGRDASTVRRNRNRLVRRLAVWMYGSAAL